MHLKCGSLRPLLAWLNKKTDPAEAPQGRRDSFPNRQVTPLGSLLPHSVNQIHGEQYRIPFGARVLTLGEHVAMYGQVHKLVQESESPLYIRDVIKLDRQDDRAAIRLFSAATLDHIVRHHPEWKGLAAYLFVFGELVDAYQNRSISHSDRLKMVLRARVFLDQWRLFLRSNDYKEDRHYISKDAHEIAMNLIDGFISLILIHRDHLQGSPPFFPWLYGTAANEHVFGLMRRQVVDFTLLDFVYATLKTSILMGMEFREGAHLSDSEETLRARASGYYHTYFQSKGLDNPSNFRIYPSDSEIDTIFFAAYEESTAIWAMLGVDIPRLERVGPASPLSPSNFGSDENENESPDAPQGASNENLPEGEPDHGTAVLATLLHDQSNPELIGRSATSDQKIMTIEIAAVSILVEESIKRYEEWEQVEESSLDKAYALEAKKQLAFLVGLQDVLTATPKNIAVLALSDADLSVLVSTRKEHQTRAAENGIRKAGRLQLTYHEPPSPHGDRAITEIAKKDVVREFQRVLEECNARDIGISTGLNRTTRWKTEAASDSKETVPGKSEAPTGNAQNAALKAKKDANAVIRRRKDAFKQVPSHGFIDEAGLSNGDQGIVEDSWGIVYRTHGPSTQSPIKLARVLTMYARKGGKTAANAYLESADSIGKLSYFVVQLYEPMPIGDGNRFRDKIPGARLPTIAHLPPHYFLSSLQIGASSGGNALNYFQLPEQEFKIFRAFRDQHELIAAGIKQLTSRKKTTGQVMDEGEQ